MSQHLKPHELAQRWNGVVTTGTLANWRSKRVGPPFIKLRGRVLYPVAQIEAWEARNTVANDNVAAAGAGEGAA